MRNRAFSPKPLRKQAGTNLPTGSNFGRKEVIGTVPLVQTDLMTGVPPVEVDRLPASSGDPHVRAISKVVCSIAFTLGLVPGLGVSAPETGTSVTVMPVPRLR